MMGTGGIDGVHPIFAEILFKEEGKRRKAIKGNSTAATAKGHRFLKEGDDVSRQGIAPDQRRSARDLSLGAALCLSIGLDACATPPESAGRLDTPVQVERPQGPSARVVPRDAEVQRTRAVATSPPAATTATGGPGEVVAPRAAARYEGTAAPGLRILLKADGSTGTGLRYRWVQTQGPLVTIDDPTSPTAGLTIPQGTGTLGFLLIVANAAGMDSIPLTIPTEGRAKGPNLSSLRADAGDDQLGMVGHQITLNGIRSAPRDQIGYRWIQTGGPSVRLKIEDGYLYSFVPSEPGIYRLALVVASGGEISEPDEVQVTVIPEGPPAAGSSVATGSTAARERRMEPLERSLRMAFASLDIGSSLSNELSQTFVAIAGRMNLYRSYDEAFSEISRRLDAIVPQDPALRGIWIERLFAPMTTWMIEQMRGEGLDLSTPGGRASAMTATQRDRLAEIFRAIGEGFRPSPPSPR